MIGFEPVRRAESAMVMEDENCTGGLGPAWEIGGRMEFRLLDEEDMVEITVGRTDALYRNMLWFGRGQVRMVRRRWRRGRKYVGSGAYSPRYHGSKHIGAWAIPS